MERQTQTDRQKVRETERDAERDSTRGRGREVTTVYKIIRYSLLCPSLGECPSRDLGYTGYPSISVTVLVIGGTLQWSCRPLPGLLDSSRVRSTRPGLGTGPSPVEKGRRPPWVGVVTTPETQCRLSRKSEGTRMGHVKDLPKDSGSLSSRSGSSGSPSPLLVRHEARGLRNRRRGWRTTPTVTSASWDSEHSISSVLPHSTCLAREDKP